MKGIWGDTLRRRVDLQEAADKTITSGSNGLGPEAGPPPPRREPFDLRERSGARHRDR